MTRARCAWAIVAASAAAAAVAQPSVPRLVDPAEVPRATPSRFAELVDEAVQTQDWVFHHSVRELSPELRELLTRVAGRDVVGPGEPFNEGDIVVYPADAQLQFAAVDDKLVVFVWYSAGFNGEELQVLIRDRVAGDAARCSFSREGSRRGALQLRNLLNEIQSGRVYIRSQYLKDGEL